jgi:hypothetical protein
MLRIKGERAYFLLCRSIMMELARRRPGYYSALHAT